MSMRIETLESAEKNRSSEETKKADEPEQPMIMAPQLMLTQGAGGFGGAPVSVYFLFKQSV